MRWLDSITDYEFGETLGDSEGQGSLACYVHGLQRVGHDLATEQQQSNCQWGCPGGTAVKKPPANAGDARDSGLILGWEDLAYCMAWPKKKKEHQHLLYIHILK